VLLTIMQRTDVPSIVHGAVTAMRVLRCLTVPGDVVGHTAQIAPAVLEGATRLAIHNANPATSKPEVPGESLFEVEYIRSPAPRFSFSVGAAAED